MQTMISTASPTTTDREPSPIWAIAVLAAVTGIGTWLRLWNLGHHSLWLDEAWLANTLLSNSLHDVIFRGPGSAAPNSTPFLLSLSIHYLTRLLGDSEFVLRLIPALFSSASIVAIWLLARRLGAATFTALLAATLIAFNPVSIDYAKELKQYAGDTFWLPLLLAGACRFAERPTWRLAIALAVGGLIAFGFAQTIALVLPGACIYLAIRSLQARRAATDPARRSVLARRSAVVVGAWMAGTALVYGLVLRHQSSERLVAFWDEFFPSSAAPGVLLPYVHLHVVGFFKWFFKTLPNIRHNGEALVSGWQVALVLASIGGLVLAIRRPVQLLFVVLMPALVAVALSTRRLFPFGAVRVDLFMLPFVILLVAFSAEPLCALLARLPGGANWRGAAPNKHAARLVKAIPAVILVYLATALALPRIEKERTDPKSREELRPLINTMLHDMEPGDVVVVLDTHTTHALTYYTRHHPIEYEVFKSRWKNDVLIKSLARAAKSAHRVWIPVAHFNRSRIDEFLQLLAARYPNLAVIDRRDAILACFDARHPSQRVPPSAFSIEFPNGEDRAPLAVDGDPETHWMSSSPREPGWHIDIELNHPERLGTIVLRAKLWPDDWSHELYAQVQAPGSGAWTSEGISVWEGPRTTIRFDNQDARIARVRLTNAQRDPKFHWSIHELEIWKRSDDKK